MYNNACKKPIRNRVMHMQHMADKLAFKRAPVFSWIQTCKYSSWAYITTAAERLPTHSHDLHRHSATDILL